LKCLVVISWPYTIGSVYIAEWRFSSHQRVMKSLFMGMCTTSAECKTIITVMLTVKSGMDPHMFSQYSGWFKIVWLLGFPVGARISWSNHPVGVGDYVGSYPVGAGDLSYYHVGSRVSL
jgi:hypothetical protein